MENDTVFKKRSKLTQNLFVKNFFPEAVSGLTRGLNASDSSSNEDISPIKSVTTRDTYSLAGSKGSKAGIRHL